MLATLALAAAAAGAAVPPPPDRWVTDQANLIAPATRADLDEKLERYELATGHQVVVWIGRSVEGADLADWAVRTFAAWQIGRAGHDDGVAIFVLAEDRQIDIEVGYGLEDRVPDVTASRIIRETMAPKLAAGDPDGALTAGVDAVITAIEGRPWIAPDEPPPPSGLTTTELVVGGIALLGLLILVIRHPRLALFMLWTMSRRGGGGGGLGGGGGGGGFGGGGGRSGGGGARGGW